MRLSDEPPHPPLTPDVARVVIAAVRRLAHAALALHALVAARRDSDQPGEVTARRLDALAAALGATMSQLALSLRTLEPPGPITALRPLQAELRDGPVIDPRLISMTDGLVGAIDTIAAILRNHIGSRATVPASSTGE